MEEILKNMEEDKKNRIINSALEEFSKNSFEKASTNNIVKKAGISKGLLFHYFNSKHELFHKLEEYVIHLITNTIRKQMDWSGSDLVERFKQISLIKIKLMNHYPYIYDFSLELLKKGSIEELKGRYEEDFADLMVKVYQENIDYTLFKEGIDLQKVVRIIQWTLEKIGEESFEKLKQSGERIDLEMLQKDVEDYLDILKKAFYKVQNEEESHD
ncbi:MAG: TetR/AcrR family transcriptional regulator [Thermotogota bacterium]|nr:TetR/AcrR family transcriptional regulator [Thermotogota bacterium]